MKIINKIECVGADGTERVFYYYSEKENNKTTYFIHTESDCSGNFFEFCVTKLGDQTGRVTEMSHHNLEEYSAKGIPDEMIKEAHINLNLEIQSSPKEGIEPGVFRNYFAQKVWKRLESKGKAVYDETKYIFVYTP